MRPGPLLNLTFSVTNACQSRCRTCRIWEIYQKDPGLRDQELTLEEIQRIFRSMGHVAVFNVSGGEPFLRGDLVEIVRLACRFLTPGVVHIPTNGLAVDRVVRMTRELVDLTADRGIQLTIKPSLDHVGEKHDALRGVPGNFDKVMQTFERLKALSREHPHLHAELGTVISQWNWQDVDEIADFATGLDPDSYRNEIAEERSEMFNRGTGITPDPRQYREAIRRFVRRVRRDMTRRSRFQRLTGAFRLVYYQQAIRILEEQRQVIPCYAGLSNAHLTPYGDIWACCTLGDDQSMGTLRDWSYDFQALWNGEQAQQVRAFIRAGRCHCPLANQAYSNILLHPPSLLRVVREVVSYA